MKLIVFFSLLFFSISNLKGQAMDSSLQDNYWVTEVGPKSKPYTVIRLYTCKDEEISAIVLKQVRLDPACRKTKKRLEQLAKNSKSIPVTADYLVQLFRINPDTIAHITHTSNDMLCAKEV